MFEKDSSSNKATKAKATQPTKPRGRPRKNPIVESINLCDKNQRLHAQDVQFPEDSTTLLLTDGRSHDTLERVAMEDNVTTSKPSAPKKPRGRPKKNQVKGSIDNLDHSNKHLESHTPVLFNMDKVCLETPERISEETCRDQNALVGVSTEKQQDIRATETISFNSVKPNKLMGIDRKKKTKDSADNLDSSNQHLQPLAVKFPDDNINVNNQYLKPLAIKFHEDTPEIVSKEDDGSKTHEPVTKKDSSRKRKANDEGHPQKSVLIASKPTLTKCKLGLKSSETATDLHLPLQKCGTSLLNAELLIHPLDVDKIL